MKAFIGTKRVNAKPMNRLEYNKFRGWELPEDENGSDEGMLVEYVDGGNSNTKDFSGYVSWSPLDVFNRAYTTIRGMTFGEAIQAMKDGQKVCRAGWNGKSMFIAISDNLQGKHLEADKFWNPHAKQATIDNVSKMVVLPTIIMKTASSEILMGWLASQTDILAEDWEVVL